jgi:hypothetical protein
MGMATFYSDYCATNTFEINSSPTETYTEYYYQKPLYNEEELILIAFLERTIRLKTYLFLLFIEMMEEKFKTILSSMFNIHKAPIRLKMLFPKSGFVARKGKKLKGKG